MMFRIPTPAQYKMKTLPAFQKKLAREDRQRINRYIKDDWAAIRRAFEKCNLENLRLENANIFQQVEAVLTTRLNKRGWSLEKTSNRYSVVPI